LRRGEKRQEPEEIISVLKPNRKKLSSAACKAKTDADENNQLWFTEPERKVFPPSNPFRHFRFLFLIRTTFNLNFKLKILIATTITHQRALCLCNFHVTKQSKQIGTFFCLASSRGTDERCPWEKDFLREKPNSF
jgi:hypothetical protein